MIIRDRLTSVTATLLVMAACLLYFPESNTIYAMAIFLTSLCSIYGLSLLIFVPGCLKLFNVLAVSLLLGYSVGSLWVVLVNINYGFKFLVYSNIVGINYSMLDLSFSLLIVLLVCAILLELSRFEKTIADKVYTYINDNDRGVGKIIIIGSIMVFVAHLTGQIGFLGVRAGDIGNIGAFGALAFLIVPPLLPITACEIRKKYSLKYRIVLLFAFILFLFTSIIFGRRIFLYSFVMILVGLSLSGFQFMQFIKKRWIIVLLCMVLLSVFVCLSFLVFYAMRIAGYSLGNDKSIIYLLASAVNLIYQDPVGLLSGLSANVLERSFILSYLAGLYSAQMDYSPLLGKEMQHAFQMAIPTLLYPEKMLFISKMPEEFIHPALGLPVFDGNNTIITAGFNDFGLIGAIGYPVIMVVVFVAFLEIAYKYLPYGLFLIVLYRFLFQLLFVEEALAGMIPICIRDLIVVVIIFLMLLGAIRLLSNILSRNKSYRVVKLIP